MNSKLNVIVFGFNDWDTWKAGGFCTRCAKYVRLLALRPEIGNILIISTPKSVFTKFWRNWRGLTSYNGDFVSKQTWFALRKVASNIFVLDHFRILPKEETANTLLKLNSLVHNRLLRRQIVKTAKSLRMDNYLLWLANPLAVAHAGKLGETLSVFDAIDDWRLHPQKTGVRRALYRAYEKINKDVDIVLTVSRLLKESLSKNRKNVFWLPNGVDVDFFSRRRPVPHELSALSGPIIEYVGTMQERIDVAILEKLAIALPDAQVVLVGPMVSPAHFKGLKKYGNVHFLGRRPHSDMPAFIQGADVCIMPHVTSEFSASMNPLKLYEYVAAGKPVVAMRTKGLEDFEEVVYFADSAYEFVKLTAQAATRQPKTLPEKQANFARSRDWSHQINELLDIIYQHNDPLPAKSDDLPIKGRVPREAAARKEVS